MTDIDVAIRRLSDLEAQVREQGYRIKALEKAGEYQARLAIEMQQPFKPINRGGFIDLGNGQVQFCPCGRDVCRAPDCPSHKTDPMGR